MKLYVKVSGEGDASSDKTNINNVLKTACFDPHVSFTLNGDPERNNSDSSSAFFGSSDVKLSGSRDYVCEVMTITTLPVMERTLLERALQNLKTSHMCALYGVEISKYELDPADCTVSSPQDLCP